MEAEREGLLCDSGHVIASRLVTRQSRRTMGSEGNEHA